MTDEGDRKKLEREVAALIKSGVPLLLSCNVVGDGDHNLIGRTQLRSPSLGTHPSLLSSPRACCSSFNFVDLLIGVFDSPCVSLPPSTPITRLLPTPNAPNVPTLLGIYSMTSVSHLRTSRARGSRCQ